MISVVGRGRSKNTELLERLEISDGLSQFVSDTIVIMAAECIWKNNYFFNAFVASTLTDKGIDVIQNPRN